MKIKIKMCFLNALFIFFSGTEMKIACVEYFGRLWGALDAWGRIGIEIESAQL